MCAKSQPQISAHDLFGFLFDDQPNGNYLAMLFKAFIDDSADQNRERVIIAGAIMGNERSWTPFYKPWRERLKADGLEYYKDSHCRTLNGQFHKFRDLPGNEGRKRADSVRNDLDAIIKSMPLITLGASLPVSFHAKMLADPAKYGPIPEIPYQLAFQQILAECAKVMTLMGRNFVVTFAHDDGDDFPALHVIYKEFKKRNPHYARVMMDFVPLDDKKHPPIQAADVAASVAYRYAEDWMADPTADNLKRLEGSVYKMAGWREGPPNSANDDFSPARVSYVQR
jgi:hypothetical protein